MFFMASISTARKNGKTVGYNIQWYNEDGRHLTIYLGQKFSKKTAERLKDVVEELQYIRRNGINVLSQTTEYWLKTVPEIRTKLGNVGLISIAEPKTCKLLWDSSLTHRAEAKPNTMQTYLFSRKRFDLAFSPMELIEDITPGRLLAWKQELRSVLAEASVASILKSTKTVFNWAVKQEWLSKCPMKEIPVGSFINRSKDRFISLAEYNKLLNACSTRAERCIIALARIGGLRFPSEVALLRWADIDLGQKRFLVRSPKTERHEGHSERYVPLFKELWTELEQYLSLEDTEDNEFVVQRSLVKERRSFPKRFQRIANKAGLGIIVRPFDNMRMSRCNEVLRKYGPLKESLWMGHSFRTLKDHYLHLTDEDYMEAAGE